MGDFELLVDNMAGLFFKGAFGVVGFVLGMSWPIQNSWHVSSKQNMICCFSGGLTSTGVSEKIQKDEEVRRKRLDLMRLCSNHSSKMAFSFTILLMLLGSHKTWKTQWRKRNEVGSCAENAAGKASHIFFKECIYCWRERYLDLIARAVFRIKVFIFSTFHCLCFRIPCVFLWLVN